MGALTVRFPQSLHAELRALAEQEGVSLNQLVVLAAAEKVAVLRRADLPEQRAALAALRRRAERLEAELAARGQTVEGRIRELLAKGPDEDPSPEDALPVE